MMNPKSSSSSILTIFTFITLFFCANFQLGFCCKKFAAVSLKKFGAIHDLTSSSEIEHIARFAVEEHNKKENTLLRFGRVLKAEEQVVAGKIYHLTLEAIDAGKKTVYEAKVWVKPWINFRQLQEFKRSHFRIAELLADDVLRWHKVPIHDPEVQDAANHAVEDIQQRSNCVCPFELLEIVQAEKEVVKDFMRYNLLLKLRSGTVEEKFDVKLHRDANGSFKLNWFKSSPLTFDY